MRTRGDERLSDRQTDALAGPSDDGSFVRQMQIHLRSFIRPARTTLLRADIGGGASLCGPYEAGQFSEIPGQVVALGALEDVSSQPSSYMHNQLFHAKDRGCTAPGYDVPGYWSEVHHIEDWATGGRTDIDKLTF